MLPVRVEKKRLTASGVVTTAGVPGECWGITMISGVQGCTFALADGGSGGTDTIGMASLTTAGNGAVNPATRELHFKPPIWFSTDIYGLLTMTDGKQGTPDAVVYVHYAEVPE